MDDSKFEVEDNTKSYVPKEEPVCPVECAVCLQPCIHPVQLPCRHIFCFLCVKGAAHRSKKCALCRQEIEAEFFNNPKLLRYEDLEKTTKFDNQYQWFYQGGNGWWQYDDRTSQELESKHKNGEKVFEILIAGFLYIIDFDSMVQVRRNDRSRKRKIRRDLVSIPGVKGVAGLKYPKSASPSNGRPVGDGNEQSSQTSNPASRTANTNRQVRQPVASHGQPSVPHTPSNTPQNPNTPVDSPPSSVQSSQQDLINQLQSLDLPSDDSDTNEAPITRQVPSGSNDNSPVSSRTRSSVNEIVRPANPASSSHNRTRQTIQYVDSDSSDNDVV
ncbi:E3 ubiquitin-protein ligase RNF146-like [Saccostrea cucullata]|uniref:E3 ubiquitin-protein ligase RNF146-like n=1 Tax=Saccostrea cuccullata TaxID=36930 RepID=UPI002ED698B0